MYRALATANAFAADGWRVTVLTADRRSLELLTGIDPAPEAAIDPRIRVVRVPFDTTRGEPDLRTWSRLRVSSPLLWSLLRTRVERLPFPETNYGGWAPALRAAARTIHAEDPVSLVIGSANPNVDFVPGQELARSGVPYVMDYRDTWHLDVYSGRRIGSPWGRSARLERRLLAGATEAWFVNEPIRDWHAAQYPRTADRFHVVANGWDPGFLALSERHPKPGRPLVFGYLGTIYGPMPLRETLDAWREARRRSPRLRSARLVIAGRLGHYATPEPSVLAVLDEFAEDGVEYAGPTSKTEVSAVYEGFDVLLLILGRSRYVTSGKVFEYAATGLPVVSVHDPETASSTTLREYPEWFPVRSLDRADIVAALLAAGDRADRQTWPDIATARAWAESLSRASQLAPRLASLRATVPDPGKQR
jgi:glycosyltransferase involved in cell wall biosynthesis